MADNDYEVLYTLSLEELGLFGFSVLQPDSLVPDSLENGYFVFVAEPDPSSNTDIIEKIFTLIIDRSGSMSGSKIIQARNAASFIVQNLNEGDKFNIVDFSDNISSFRPNHVEYNQTNQSQALAYISALQANGLTNISGAFDTAVPQFNNANDSTANIIIFLTDGVPTAGISGTEQLVAHINQLVQTTETDLMIFSFGIGLDVNQQLLGLISNSNSGFATFLLNNELEEVITTFYLKIRNPVLLNTSISFGSTDVVEVYPDPLPNLYKGQQMIVSGRYNTPGVTSVTLQGDAFNQPVSYNYNLELSDSSSFNYRFIPKVWAKQKIEYLLVQYYLLNPNSPEAKEIKNKIIQISIAYGVISPFTSFTGGGTTNLEEEQTNENNIITEFKIIGNYPNPFNPETTIRFSVGKVIDNIVKIKIYNSLGELVRILIVYINREGIYEVRWDGKNSSGSEVPSDVYIYVVDFGNIVLADKMILMK
jgi:Ca-activated chloride channel family protein